MRVGEYLASPCKFEINFFDNKILSNFYFNEVDILHYKLFKYKSY